jgi:hypothetical protein
MSKSAKILIVPAFLLGFLATACDAGAAGDKAGDDGFEQAVAYAECMRANGVPNFPDPERQGGGVRVSVPKSTPELERAKAACRDREPQGEAEAVGGDPVDAAKLTAWTNCMRAKLPKFPDAEVSGNTVTVTLTGTGLRSESTAFENARRECDAQSPSGNLRVVG